MGLGAEQYWKVLFPAPGAHHVNAGMASVAAQGSRDPAKRAALLDVLRSPSADPHHDQLRSCSPFVGGPFPKPALSAGISIPSSTCIASMLRTEMVDDANLKTPPSLI